MSIHVSSNSEGTRTFRLTIATRVRGNSDYSFAEEEGFEPPNVLSVIDARLFPNYYAIGYLPPPTYAHGRIYHSSIPQYLYSLQDSNL